MTEDNRRFERFPIARITFAEDSATGDTCCGVLKNISAGGAMIDLSVPLVHSDHIFTMGMPVDVTIDEFEPLKGNVVRVDKEIIGVSFTIDDKGQTDLMGQILTTMEEEGATADK